MSARQFDLPAAGRGGGFPFGGLLAGDQFVARAPHGDHRYRQRLVRGRPVVLVHLDVGPQRWQQHLPEIGVFERGVGVAGEVADLAQELLVAQAGGAGLPLRPGAGGTADKQLDHLGPAERADAVRHLVGEDGAEAVPEEGHGRAAGHLVQHGRQQVVHRRDDVGVRLLTESLLPARQLDGRDEDGVTAVLLAAAERGGTGTREGEAQHGNLHVSSPVRRRTPRPVG